MVEARQRMMNNRPTFQALMAQKARLNQRRLLAQKQRNEPEVAAAVKELEDLEARYPELRQAERTTGVSEINRKAELENRRAQEEADREARRRKAALAIATVSRDIGRPATPPVKDFSARVKTISKISDGNSRSVPRCVRVPGIIVTLLTTNSARIIVLAALIATKHAILSPEFFGSC